MTARAPTKWRPALHAGIFGRVQDRYARDLSGTRSAGRVYSRHAPPLAGLLDSATILVLT
jgi:hypothetical protein